MKTVGIIGGIGPESTLEYYKFIIEAYRRTKADGSYPPIIINSVDLQKMIALMEANQLSSVADYLVVELDKLARAGADFGLLASNTPHIVFEEVERRSPLPLISIVAATCDAARSLGLQKIGLFGTRFTMQADFYPRVFSRSGIEVVVPSQT
jgi:aspartate racemase